MPCSMLLKPCLKSAVWISASTPECHAAFGQHFAKPGILDAKYHRWLLDAFDKRILGDYSYEMEVTKEDAEQMLVQSREFVAAARSFLEAQDRSD